MRRFLLDQNFPPPPVVPSMADATVDYVPLIEFDPALAERQTPDWLIILTAANAGQFDGLVTRDAAQLDQAEEMLAVMRSALASMREELEARRLHRLLGLLEV